ncbi:MAG: fumarylacetoacetate hydrolase family protein [Armatimonadota bacterium]|nr:fumarylacetoacetate hydrolase family protein [Armatimonadota bacterium]MDR7486000.1 fumarylacetoacetate hydrolase family protein [Armatimonadota bacterium]MDR7532571.1 fumarylacetoacetate hydrolase family protein [Armatimonadota bacterium]MDR7536220.1 fumarylacetoacetate hydrolase family protein [Armatimonadota bacterium]
MRRCRFIADGRVHRGWLEGAAVRDERGRVHAPDACTWLPPVAPSKIVGFALTYRDHAAELAVAAPEEPAVFFKPPSSLVGHGAPVVSPPGVTYLHYEAELAVVIGRRCRGVRPEAAPEVVRGYTIANDVTARDFIRNFFRPPVRAKGWDTFCPLGPTLVEGEIADPHRLGLRAYVNGELRQQGTTADLAVSIWEQIAFVSAFMTLEPDDVILTGTPRGISPVRPGDRMRIEIDGLGALENPVVDGTAHDRRAASVASEEG